MKKENQQWSIATLQEKIDDIEFPEYQREPTVWDLDRKRKLIDSILRNFDIASIYLYKREDGNYDCIDGRQRINAIISFLGLNFSNNGIYSINTMAFIIVDGQRGITISDCQIYDHEFGIFAVGGGGIFDVNIINNDFQNNGMAIYLIAVTEYNILRNKIHNSNYEMITNKKGMSGIVVTIIK